MMARCGAIGESVTVKVSVVWLHSAVVPKGVEAFREALLSRQCSAIVTVGSLLLC